MLLSVNDSLMTGSMIVRWVITSTEIVHIMTMMMMINMVWSKNVKMKALHILVHYMLPSNVMLFGVKTFWHNSVSKVCICTL